MNQKFSNCCGVPDRIDPESGSSYQDSGLCSFCGEHCEYLDPDTIDSDQARDLEEKAARTEESPDFDRWLEMPEPNANNFLTFRSDRLMKKFGRRI
jgi:hypothetical protein